MITLTPTQFHGFPLPPRHAFALQANRRGLTHKAIGVLDGTTPTTIRSRVIKASRALMTDLCYADPDQSLWRADDDKVVAQLIECFKCVDTDSQPFFKLCCDIESVGQGRGSAICFWLYWTKRTLTEMPDTTDILRRQLNFALLSYRASKTAMPEFPTKEIAQYEVEKQKKFETKKLIEALRAALIARSGIVSTVTRKPDAVPLRSEALSKPIFWRGRQWAVTAHGIEALDGTYAIASDRLKHDDECCDWLRHMAVKNWVDEKDFAEAVFRARLRHD